MKNATPLNAKRWFSMFTMIAGALAVFVIGCANQPTTADSGMAAAAATEPGVVVLPATPLPDNYRIGPGDVLEISVWKNPDLSRIVVVLPDGTITFPLVGRFVAGGKTVDQLREEMEKKISRYVPEPDLTLIVQQVNSMVVYVIGKVNRPGHFPLTRNIDVMQALAMAGGLNIFANPKDIRILRKSPDSTKVMPFNYVSVTEDNAMEGNIMLKAGDVIVVK